MTDPGLFRGLRLVGGFTVVGLDLVAEPLVDAMGRRAIATTQIVGRELRLTVFSGLDAKEWSVTLYHEVLEAITVASVRPPARVMEFNEGDFERAGYEAHERFGPASPENLNRMLQFHEFREE
jgi:hypothetical protein